MATIINNPGERTSESSGVGIVVGVILAIIVIFLFFRFALPGLRGNPAPQNGMNVNVELPSGGTSPAPAGGAAQ